MGCSGFNGGSTNAGEYGLRECPTDPAAAQVCFCEGLSTWLSCEPCVAACTFNSADTVSHHQFAGGDFFSCGVTTAGTVKCWGSNSYGQLGDGSDGGRTVPGIVPGLGGVVSVVAGAGHACALTAGGSVKCWGSNATGALGDKSTSNRATPVDVFGLSSGVKAITAGGGHSCAILSSGALKCWGNNSMGQLGDRTSNNYANEPVDVYGLQSGVASVTAGAAHTCAAMSDGTVKCWGTGTKGVNGSTVMATAPTPLNGISGALSLSSGWNHMCALLLGGEVKCWGDNSAGQLGRGFKDALNAYPSPMTVMGLAFGAGELSSGLMHSCVVKNDGMALCWGWNGWGQLGNGQAGNMGGNPIAAVTSPGQVFGLDRFSLQLGSGSRHNCAFGPAHALRCWGENLEGQLGDGSKTQRTSATSVPGF